MLRTFILAASKAQANRRRGGESARAEAGEGYCERLASTHHMTVTQTLPDAVAQEIPEDGDKSRETMPSGHSVGEQ